MTNKLFIGNLSWNIKNDELSDIFGQVGKVISANVVLDRDTGRSKGFAFVVMETPEEAQKAIDVLSGTPIDGRHMRVEECLPERKGMDRPNGTALGELLRRIEEFLRSANNGEFTELSFENKEFVLERRT